MRTPGVKLQEPEMLPEAPGRSYDKKKSNGSLSESYLIVDRVTTRADADGKRADADGKRAEADGKRADADVKRTDAGSETCGRRE